ALAAGASIVNDITAGRGDPRMFPLIARTGAAIILMHMQGTPATMQVNPVYQDVTRQVIDFLLEQHAQAVKSGIAKEKILLDPGLGFGKTITHNLTLLRDT